MSLTGPFAGSSPFSVETRVGLPAPRRTTEETPPHVVLLRQAARVDLLPAAVVARQHLRRLRGVLAAAVVAVLLALAGAGVHVHGQVSQGEEDLAAEEARTAQLQVSRDRYAELPLVLAQREEVEDARSQAMSTDVLWYRYVAALTQGLPAGTSVQDLSVTTTSAGTTEASTTEAGTTEAGTTEAGTTEATQVADPLAATALGSVSLSVTTGSQQAVADLLELLAATPGLSDAWVVSDERSSTAGAGYAVVLRAGVTADALSHRYDRAER